MKTKSCSSVTHCQRIRASLIGGLIWTLLLTGCAGTHEASYAPDRQRDSQGGGSPDAGIDITVRADGKEQGDVRPALTRVGVACTAGAQCQSGFCADGYCCDRSCSGACLMCDVKGAEGLCTPIPVNTDPDDECKGESGCGGDMCDGLGKCTKPELKTKLCNTSCLATMAEWMTEQYCDGAGKCAGAAKSRHCSPFLCRAGTGGAADVCAKGCKVHSDCVKGSVCDGSNAHKQGAGVCVDPKLVLEVSTHQEMLSALLSLEKGTSTKTHLFITSKSIQGPFAVDGYKVTILGRGAGQTAITPYQTWPNLFVRNGGDLTVQGINVTGSASWGILCEAIGKKTPSLTLLESTVQGSAQLGVGAGKCHAELRRNLITNNKGGGIAILGGGVVVNNIIVGNGTLANKVGGAVLAGDKAGKFTFENNTVMDNLATTKAGYGVKCGGVLSTFKNNIVWSHGLPKGDVVTSGCKFSYSMVHGLSKGPGLVSKAPGLDAQYMPRQKPKSPCINAGAASSVTVIDLAGSPRPSKAGARIDIGAYEVK